MKTPLRIGFLIVLQLNAQACIWDSDTLTQEEKKNPEIARVILGEAISSADPAALRERIKTLQARRREADPAWWNDLAGAHLRLGEPKEAAALLEPLRDRFPNDYGIHANLGTAYHLMGDYQKAEKEIARDLELNPDAHFGLERYHLALLQYLVREPKYQARHVYVDEFSEAFLRGSGPLLASGPLQGTNSGVGFSASDLAEMEKEYNSTATSNYEADHILSLVSALDRPPAYRARWNLAEDPKFKEGILYLASLNPKEPACFVMLGVASWHQQDLNLAAAAFEKAIELHSPQSEILKRKVEGIRAHIREAQQQPHGGYQIPRGVVVLGVAIVTPIVLWICVRAMPRRSPGH
jgi:tetratricopeptide (TPR) repeat protein